MKIAFLLGNLQGNGGIARVVSIIANQLCNDNKVYIVSYCPSETDADYEYNDTIHTMRLFEKRISMREAILKHHAVSKLRRFVRSNKINLLIACGQLYFPLGILGTEFTDAECCCWEHSNPAVTTDNKFQMFSRKVAVKYADKIIVLTEKAQKFYTDVLKCDPGIITQIYNPIGENVARSLKYDLESKKILSVGRLTYPKNFQLLVYVAAEILPDYPDWTWEICGEGEDRAELEKLIQDNNLNGRVILRGQVKDMYTHYREYAFLVMTSRYEGFPMSLVEAGANRLPLISFDIPTGPSEIIQDSVNGYLVPNGDTQLFIKDILALIREPSLRQSMSEKAYENSARFNIDKIIKQWRTIF